MLLLTVMSNVQCVVAGITSKYDFITQDREQDEDAIKKCARQS
jgi:hypothetical protein